MDRYYRRNYLLLFLESVIFINAITFISVNSVIPYFLNTLGASTFQIGLVSALSNIGNFSSQLLFARKAMELNYKIKPFVKILTVQRLFFLLFAFTIPFLATKNPKAMIAWFLICWGIFSFFVGSYSPFYVSILSKIIPYRNRGRLLGYSGAVANLSALASSYIISLMLKNIGFPFNYTYIFGIGVVLLLLDNIDFMLIKEPPERVEDNLPAYVEMLRNVPKTLLGNKKFAVLVTIYSLIMIANISLAYYVVYAIKEFKAGDTSVAIFTAIPLVVNTVGNAVFGIVGDHYGQRKALQMAAASGILGGTVALLIHNIYGVYLAFALSNLCMTGYFLSNSILITRIAPSEKLPLYISISNMITLIVSSIALLTSGRLIDILSFKPIFAVSASAAFIAWSILHINSSSIDVEGKEQIGMVEKVLE